MTKVRNKIFKIRQKSKVIKTRDAIKDRNYWIISNKPQGYYDNNDWDMSTIFRTKYYTIREKENNRKYIKPGDIVYLRIFGSSFIGKFIIRRSWEKWPKRKQKYKSVIGAFKMKDVQIWKRSIPQDLIIREISNQSYRPRIIKISQEDSVVIETVKRVFEKLGFGEADGECIILEKGLEEAIKPNLEKFGLKLADEHIRQQFPMELRVGRSDLICTDKKGDFVILELKRGMSSDQVVGQVLRYMGWLQENIAKKKKKVHGWIITGGYDEQLRLAASAAGIKLLRVRIC